MASSIDSSKVAVPSPFTRSTASIGVNSWSRSNRLDASVYFLPFAIAGSLLVARRPGEVVPVQTVGYLTWMPIERAVPATWSLADARSLALRSGSLISAISVTWASVIEPAVSRPGLVAALSNPAA